MKTVKENHFNVQTKLELFDNYVGSTLNYGCEIWGNHKGPDIERVRLKFLKRLLGVKRSSNSMMVYKELKRYPRHINKCVRQVWYWIKLKNSSNCIARSVFDSLFSEWDSLLQNKYSLLRDIKVILSSVGMNDVWVHPDNTSVQLLAVQLRQRLQDIFLQNLDSELENSSKCILYKQIVSDNRQLQFYLSKPLLDQYKLILAKYRLSSHHIELWRYSRIEKTERKCCMCSSNDIEDEFHFILVCQRYKNIRDKFIGLYYYNRPSVYKLTQLFQRHCTKKLNNIAKYLIQATKLRSELI